LVTWIEFNKSVIWESFKSFIVRTGQSNSELALKLISNVTIGSLKIKNHGDLLVEQIKDIEFEDTEIAYSAVGDSYSNMGEEMTYVAAGTYQKLLKITLKDNISDKLNLNEAVIKFTPGFLEVDTNPAVKLLNFLEN